MSGIKITDSEVRRLRIFRYLTRVINAKVREGDEYRKDVANAIFYLKKELRRLDEKKV